jgi:hypothetical protein
MSILTKAKKLSAVAFNPGIMTCDSKYLFILSHMRSRSSVLSHILGSNDGVCGYSELHSSYIRYIDILKMRVKLYSDLRCNLRGKYLLDKILHNSIVISKEMFETTTPKIIFLLRDAESTINSIINMGYLANIDWYKNPEKVAEYYCSRLSCLKKYAETVGEGYYFLESDDLVNNTDYVLSTLTKWLSLDKPLCKSYSVFNNTGKPGHGDLSANIKSGKVIKTKGYSNIEVSQKILKQAKFSYNQLRASLMSGAIQ